MSRHDYMNKSGYAESAYQSAYPEPDHVHKSDFFDAEGRRWAVTQTHGVRTIVRRKVESYVQEVLGSATPTYSSSVTMGFPSKGSGPLISSDHPQAVNELLTKIFTEVNGTPHKVSDPNPGTNRGRHNFPHEPADPNLGREVDGIRSYGASPMKGDPIGGPHAYASDPHRTRGRYSYPIREELVYEYRDDPTYGSSPTKVDPSGGYGYDYSYVNSPRKPERGPSHQWDQSSSPVYDGPPQAGYGVPNPPPRNYQLPDDEWSNPSRKSQTQGFGVQDNQSPRAPNSSKNHQVQKNGWGGSPMRPHTPSGHGVYPDNVYAVKPEEHSPREYNGPENKWESSRIRDYGLPINNWGNSSTLVHDHPQDKPGEQWQGSGYGKPTNQRENPPHPIYNHLGNDSSSPRNQVGSSPLKARSNGGYEVPNNQPKIAQNQPQKSPSGLENQWGLAPVKTHSTRNYGTPRREWGGASSLDYSPLGNNSSEPKDQWRRFLEETQRNQEGRSSTPTHVHNQNNQSSPKKQWSMKIESPKGNGVSSPKKQWGRPSEDYRGPKDPPWGSSPANSFKGNEVSTNQPTPVYEEEQYKPPPHELNYKDGVYTPNDRPQRTHTHDQPKDNTNNFPTVTQPISYSNAQSRYQGLGLRPTRYTRVNPSGYNLANALEQLNLGPEAPHDVPTTTTKSTAYSGPTRFDSVESSRDIDSREAARRYGGNHIPTNPYQSVETQNKTITSKQALDKYHGSSLPNTK